MNTDDTLPDLTSRADIIRLVDAFYDRIRRDEKLGPIFNDIAQVNWETHLPKMYDFWDTVLFRAGTFRGNPLAAHAKLVSTADMSKASFDHWLDLFFFYRNYKNSNPLLLQHQQTKYHFESSPNLRN